MSKRPEIEDVRIDLSGVSNVPKERGKPPRFLRDKMAAVGGRMRQGIGDFSRVLYNGGVLDSQAISEGGVVSRSRDQRPTRPSEMIDNDLSAGAVFLVVILLMIVVAAALFFALSSTFPSFSGP